MNVTVDAANVKAIMPDVGIGLHTSVYANNFGISTVPGAIADGGIQLLRYPGGNYASIYHWTNHTASGGYAASQSHFGNFVTKLMEGSGARGMVTVNYGSNHTNTIGGQPEEAAAWVAYANGDASLYGSPNDIVIGVDEAGKDWFTVGYWANLRASTPAQVPGTSLDFLAINRDDPIGIKYWEVGNELNGNGYYGDPGWQHDLHAPYDGNRMNNPALSPAAYATNFNEFAAAMKAVDPTIKVGGVLVGPGGYGDTGDPNTNWDAQMLPIAGPNMDFGIIHYYVNDGPGDDTNLVLNATDDLPGLFNTVRNRIDTYVGPGASDEIELHMTEFGYFGTVSSAAIDGVYAANTYATMLADSLTSVHWLELSKNSYLGDGVPTPGGAYYGIQIFSHITETGAEFVQTTSSAGSVEVNSTVLPDGSAGILIANLNSSGSRTVNINISNIDLDESGTTWLYGVNQTTPLETPLATGLGNSFSVSVPFRSIMAVRIDAAPTQPGDFDGDLDVDGDDFLIWQRDLASGPNAAALLADWETYYGTVPALGASTAVPEPASLTLVAAGIIAALVRLQRRS